MARNLYRQARKLCAPVVKNKGTRPGDLYEIRKAEWIKNNPDTTPAQYEEAIAGLPGRRLYETKQHAPDPV